MKCEPRLANAPARRPSSIARVPPRAALLRHLARVTGCAILAASLAGCGVFCGATGGSGGGAAGGCGAGVRF